MSRSVLCFAMSLGMAPAMVALGQTPSLNRGDQLSPPALLQDEVKEEDAPGRGEDGSAQRLSPSALPSPAPYPSSPTGMDAERAKVWNSPQMLRARAWLQEYCARSAKVTPEEAQQYTDELERLTPTQMKLWLLKFQEHEEVIEQQQAAFNMQRQAGVKQAAAVNQATQQSYADINTGETAKAESAEQSIQNTNQFAQQMSAQLSADRDYRATLNSLPWGMAWANQTPWGPYAGYPMGTGPYGPVGGGGAAPHYHVHYHLPAPAAPAAGGGP